MFERVLKTLAALFPTVVAQACPDNIDESDYERFLVTAVGDFDLSELIQLTGDVLQGHGDLCARLRWDLDDEENEWQTLTTDRVVVCTHSDSTCDLLAQFAPPRLADLFVIAGPLTPFAASAIFTKAKACTKPGAPIWIIGTAGHPPQDGVTGDPRDFWLGTLNDPSGLQAVYVKPGQYIAFLNQPKVLPERVEELEKNLIEVIDEFEADDSAVNLSDVLADHLDVFIPREEMSIYPFLAGVPYPKPPPLGHIRDALADGYVRGRIVGRTKMCFLVVVTATKLPGDIERALRPPQFRIFNSRFVAPYPGSTPGPDECPFLDLRDVLRYETGRLYRALPRLAEFFPTSLSFATESSLSMAGSGGADPFVPALLTLSLVGENWGVFYDGDLQRLIPRRGVEVVHDEDGTIRVQDDATGAVITMIPAPPKEERSWWNDGWQAFVDGSWVGDAHMALYGVWQAADPIVGPAASSGVIMASAGLMDHLVEDSLRPELEVTDSNWLSPAIAEGARKVAGAVAGATQASVRFGAAVVVLGITMDVSLFEAVAGWRF